MPFSESIMLQMTIVLLLATIVFWIAYTLPQKIAGSALILLIPFQPVETRFGTANVALTFVVFIAMLMRETNIRLPMLPQILLLMFVYLLSMSQTHESTHVQHAVYLVYVVSAFLVFWISYDLTLRYTLRGIVQLFLVMNVLVIIYCLIQLAVGPGTKLMLFGREEFAMAHTRQDRLTGPFSGVGVAAEYFVIMVYVIMHQILTATSARVRWLLAGLLGCNFLLLVATGNRGGFLTLIGAGVLYLWMFRHLLGVVRTIRIAIIGTILLAMSAAITVQYTSFNRLFDRLLETEIDEGVPDTRSVVWPMAWEAIKEKPLLGNGPRLRLIGDENPRAYPEHVSIMYPHNLYLFLVFTIGVVGLVAFLILLGTPLYRCWKTAKMGIRDPVTLSFIKTGTVLMVIIFVDQIKVEFMRYALVDYWHFVFALLGVLVAVCDRTQHSLALAQTAAVPAGPVPEPAVARRQLSAR